MSQEHRTMSILSRLFARSRVRASKPRLQRKNARFLPRLELLEARQMLDATAVANAEHLAVFGVVDANGVVTGGLVPDAAVTVKSIASGNWSSPAVWSTGNVPSAS